MSKPGPLWVSKCRSREPAGNSSQQKTMLDIHNEQCRNFLPRKALYWICAWHHIARGLVCLRACCIHQPPIHPLSSCLLAQNSWCFWHHAVHWQMTLYIHRIRGKRKKKLRNVWHIVSSFYTILSVQGCIQGWKCIFYFYMYSCLLGFCLLENKNFVHVKTTSHSAVDLFKNFFASIKEGRCTSVEIARPSMLWAVLLG